MGKPLQVTPSHVLKQNKKKAKARRGKRAKAVPVFRLHPLKVKALTTVMTGGSVKEAAAQANVTERSVRYWIEQYWTLSLTENPQIWNLWGKVHDMALKVVMKELRKGNIDVAMTIFKTTPFFAMNKPQINVDASKNLTVNDNSVKIDKTDITINPKEDPAFVNGAITELERMARLSQIPAVSERDS